MNTRVVGSYGRWRPFLQEARYECVRAWRAPGFSVPALVLPMAFYLFFGVVMADADRTASVDLFVFTGFGVMGVMAPGLFGFGAFVAVEREQGLLRLKRALPMPASAYLLARLAMTMVFALLATSGIIAAALVSGRLPANPVPLVAASSVLAAGSLPFCAMGLLIGSCAGARSAPAIVNLLFLPMIYLSGLLIPLPDSIAGIQVVLPAYHLDQLALGAMGLPIDGIVAHAAILAGITLVCGGLALARLVRGGA